MSTSGAGKGDCPRPFSVSREIYNLRYEIAYGKCPTCNNSVVGGKFCSNPFHLAVDKLHELENTLVKDIVKSNGKNVI